METSTQRVLHFVFRAWVLLAMLALAGCEKERHTDLPDLLGSTIANGVLDRSITLWNEPSGTLQSVPVIVVGFVEENRIVVSRVAARRYKGVYLDLHEVRCKRENSLKGGLIEKEFTFAYFSDGRYPEAQPNPLYKRSFKADPGERYLFFLTRDGDVLRSIGDVGEFSIPINSGRHVESRIEPGDISQLIAKILLAPGDGADLDRMAQTLPAASQAVESWGSRLIAAQLLRRLLVMGEPLRSMACGVLVERFRGQIDCLEAIADDPDEPASIRSEAAKESREKSALREQFLEGLKDPAERSFADFAGDSRHRMREELEMFLLNEKDRVQHERVCTALKRYFPWEAEPKCAHGK